MNTPNNIDRQAHSLAHSQDPSKWPDPEISAVQDQSTDINIIMKTARNTGQLTLDNLVPLTDSEFLLDIESYGDVLRKTAQAEKTFMTLPPEVRAKFDNNPVNAHNELSAMSPENLLKEIESWQSKKAPQTTSSVAGQQPVQQTPQSQQSAASSVQNQASQSATQQQP